MFATADHSDTSIVAIRLSYVRVPVAKRVRASIQPVAVGILICCRLVKSYPVVIATGNSIRQNSISCSGGS